MNGENTPWIYHHLAYAHSRWMSPKAVTEEEAILIHDTIPHEEHELVKAGALTHDHG